MNARVLALTLVCWVVAAPAGSAQREPKKAETARFGDPTSTARVYQDYLYGVIKKVGSTELVLDKTKFGIDQTIALERKTKFIHDGKPSSLDHLKVGDQVWVDVKKDKKTGSLVAKKVLTGVVTTSRP